MRRKTKLIFYSRLQNEKSWLLFGTVFEFLYASKGLFYMTDFELRVSCILSLLNPLLFPERGMYGKHFSGHERVYVYPCGHRLTGCRLHTYKWAAPSEFVTYRLCEQRRFRRACASAQYRQNLRCSLIKAVSQEEPSDRKLDPWPRWMAGHAQLKFVMTECSKTQIRLSRPK